MDAEISLEGIISDSLALLEAKDFEGAEEVLLAALAHHGDWEPFLHFQLGRIYHRWNKLSSAANHLHRAAELLSQYGDRFTLMQVVEELKAVRKGQTAQRP